jgi:uncharacterized Ntn-hydrolase superfamily protein
LLKRSAKGQKCAQGASIIAIDGGEALTHLAVRTRRGIVRPMTWSIIARDEPTGRVGIAVATRFFAVGAMVPHIRSGVGAVATQAFMNPFYGPKGLDLIAQGMAAEAVIRTLIAADDGRESRQLHVMDRQSAFAAHTGKDCVDWCGSLQRPSFSIAGNMLAGAAVIVETAKAFEANLTMPFARRLIAALKAGEAAGGDKRGKQSAALLIHDGEDYPLYDLRVDDHPDPLAELARLQVVARERYVHFRRRMPSNARPAGDTDRSTMDAFVARSIAEGYE